MSKTNKKDIKKDKKELTKEIHHNARVITALIIAFVLISLIILEGFGFRFITKNTVESAWTEENVIHADGWDFYYLTNTADGKGGEYIDSFVPVRHYGFLKKALKNYEPKYTLYNEQNTIVGTLHHFRKGSEHYWLFKASSDPCDESIQNWYNEKELSTDMTAREFIKGSYFTTESEFETLTLCGEKLHLKDYKEEDIQTAHEF